MTSTRFRRLLMAFVILAVALGAYFAGRSEPRSADVAGTSFADDAKGSGAVPAFTTANAAAKPAWIRAAPSLPPPDASLKDTFAELHARSLAGDVSAATRLYRDLSRCNHLRGNDWGYARTMSDFLNENVDGKSAIELEDYDVQLDAAEESQRVLEKVRDMCAGIDDDIMDALVPTIRQAALLGDGAARACYLSRGPNYDTRGMLRHPEQLETYRSTASSLIESGVIAGDWRVVDLLRHAYEPGAQGMLAGLVGPDPGQHYRYLKLYRLGAEDYRANALDQQLAGAAAQLTRQQIEEFDAWAEQTFNRSFSGYSTESAVEGWEPCG